MDKLNMKQSALALMLVLGSDHMVIPLALGALFVIGLSGIWRDSSQFRSDEYFITVIGLFVVYLLNRQTAGMFSQEGDYCLMVIKAAFLVWFLHNRFNGAAKIA
jgi:hypothetical protein